MKLAITGANGYIGKTLVRHLIRDNVEFLALSRNKINSVNHWLKFDLQDTQFSFPPEITCVVHLAMNLDVKNEAEQLLELNAVERLLKSSQQIGARFIYISSQTAAESASTLYGTTKWKIEQLVQAYGGISIRPGLVYGGTPSGLYLQLIALTKSLFFIPTFFPAPMVQPIHVDDLCDAITHIAHIENTKDLYSIASEKGVPFDYFLKCIGFYRTGKNKLPLFIPTILITLGRILLPNNSQLVRLNSLFTLPKMNTSSDLASIGLTLKELHLGVAKSKHVFRRNLLIEANILLGYILGCKPSPSLLRRYARCIETLRTELPLGFANFLIFSPWVIAVLESRKFQSIIANHDEFLWRLNAATTIAESSTIGAVRFLGLSKKSSLIAALIQLFMAISFEIIVRFIRLLGGRLLCKLCFRKNP